ncbi:MAG: protein serine/threonine phosphatase 2C family protein [Myxococcales bacterium]|nr:MAG: protein serine/threonine phosphatase 2C family protein [Myxococcales bacterium]
MAQQKFFLNFFRLIFFFNIIFSSLLLASNLMPEEDNCKKIFEKYSLDFATVTQQTNRKSGPNEDRFINVNKASFAFFGVFDGHRGYGMSQYAKDVIYPSLNTALQPDFKLQEQSIVTSFEYANNGYRAQRTSKPSGSTAAVLIIARNERNEEGYFLAHTGDSRILVGELGDENIFFATADHNWECESEQERIKKFSCQPKKELDSILEPPEKYRKAPQVVQKKRDSLGNKSVRRKLFLCENENPDRSESIPISTNPHQDLLSDQKIITKVDWEEESPLSEMTRALGYGKHKCGLTYEPEIKFVPLVRGQNKFFIIASDGFWDNISNDDAYTQTKKLLDEREDAESIVHQLMIASAKKDESNPYREDQEKENLLSGIRDDITISVVILTALPCHPSAGGDDT